MLSLVELSLVLIWSSVHVCHGGRHGVTVVQYLPSSPHHSHHEKDVITFLIYLNAGINRIVVSVCIRIVYMTGLGWTHHAFHIIVHHS